MKGEGKTLLRFFGKSSGADANPKNYRTKKRVPAHSITGGQEKKKLESQQKSSGGKTMTKKKT